MHVSLVRSGGFTGQHLTSSVDTDELPQAQATETLRALDALAAAPVAIPSAGASQPRYRLTVLRDDGEQVVELTESQVPSALRPLISELVRRAQART
jgi:hypothetical protein